MFDLSFQDWLERRILVQVGARDKPEPKETADQLVPQAVPVYLEHLVYRVTLVQSETLLVTDSRERRD